MCSIVSRFSALLSLFLLVAGVVTAGRLSAAEDAASSTAELLTPEAFLGHPVGADRKLARYARVLEYLRQVEAASDRVSIVPVGESTLGEEMVLTVLTSAANQGDLDRYRQIARTLAQPDRLDEQQAEELIATGKPIVLITCTIHATEVGSTQMAMEFVHQFATTEDPDQLAWMDDMILILMPSLNPDGQNLVIDWYDKYVGTEFEGGRMPWLYHHYIGHDNNRDFYMLTQAESKNLNRVLYRDWFPQVFVDEHQMGSTGPRMFVPPQTDPLAPEIHPLIFRQADLIGTNMSFRLEEEDKQGVGHNMIFDSYWPGGTRNTAWWKNVTGLLTEVASVRIASPIYIDPGELRGGSKGFPEYKRRANFPSVWEGGWWRLRDIIDYELIATWATVESAALYGDELLHNFYRMNRQAIEQGQQEGPSAWVVPTLQHDPVAAARLVDLMIEHGIRTYRLDEPLRLGLRSYPAGSVVFPAAQPYRPFLLTMLRPQRYPEVRPHADGPIIPPYDVTSWSLPISMGVAIEEVTGRLSARMTPITEAPQQGHLLVDAEGGHIISHRADSAYTLMNRVLEAGGEVHWLNEAGPGVEVGDIFLPTGSTPLETLRTWSEELRLSPIAMGQRPAGDSYQLAAPRVGLYKPWVASMDEGWTRFLLEQYEFPYVNLSNEQIQKGEFKSKADVLLFPDVSASIMQNGKPKSEQARRRFSPLPPEYAGGIEAEGGEQLADWIRGGGTVVALDSSTQYFIDLLELPVLNVLQGASRNDFYAPGSMLRIEVDNTHPLGYGLRPEEAAYFASSPAFRTSVPDARIDRQVIARYPDHRDDILISGFLQGAERLERRAAMVEYSVGEGKVVLIGFRAQHRAQPLRTFKLLFNALYKLEARQAPAPSDSAS